MFLAVNFKSQLEIITAPAYTFKSEFYVLDDK